MESSCDTLFMCIITTFKEGIRAGGGISDVLRKPASQVPFSAIGVPLILCNYTLATVHSLVVVCVYSHFES